MESIRNAPKWRTNSLCLLHDNAPAHRPVLVKDFLAYIYMTTLQHSHTPLTQLQLTLPVPSTAISIEGAAFLLCCWQLWMRRKSWKDLSKMDSRSVSISFTFAEQSVYLQKEANLKEMWLKWFTILYFSEIKWFRYHFKATTYICKSENDVERKLQQIWFLARMPQMSLIQRKRVEI